MNNLGIFPVEKMCKVFKVSRSSYYYWLKNPITKTKREQKMFSTKIRQIYDKSKGTYGSPRITKELRMHNYTISQKRVANLMRKLNIRSIVKKKYRVTTDSNHKYPIAPNLLQQQFNVKQIGKVWVSDITYIKTKNGWLYLTVIIDLADRKVIGWALSNNLTTKDTIIIAWKMAVKNRPITKPLIFHSDRGIQYASKEFTNMLKTTPLIKQSMSRKGNCWDNAVAESFFKSLKVECVYQHKLQNKNHAAFIVFEYIETWYNRNRRHSALENLTILEHEKLKLNINKKLVA